MWQCVWRTKKQKKKTHPSRKDLFATDVSSLLLIVKVLKLIAY